MIKANKSLFSGLDHRAGHFRPLRIIVQTLESLVLSIVRCFWVVQKQKGVAGAMIEAFSVALKMSHDFWATLEHKTPESNKSVRSKASGITSIALWIKHGQTIDFLLTEQRDEQAAKRFLTKAIRRHGVPEKITIDGSDGQ